MDKKILKEEHIMLRTGRTAPLRIAQLPNGKFEASLDLGYIIFSSQFKQEETAIAFSNYLKARFMKK